MPTLPPVGGEIFLNAELAKYETWDRVNKFIKSLFASPESFTKTRQTGVGQTTTYLRSNKKTQLILINIIKQIRHFD
jgi:hypothetical protein